MFAQIVVKTFLYIALCILILGCAGNSEKATAYRNAIEGALPGVSSEAKFLRLDGEFKDLSTDGIVYITRSNGDSFYLFRTYLGKAANFHGILYSPNRTLRKNDEITLNSGSARGTIPWNVTVTAKMADDVVHVSSDFLD